MLKHVASCSYDIIEDVCDQKEIGEEIKQKEKAGGENSAYPIPALREFNYQCSLGQLQDKSYRGGPSILGSSQNAQS